MILDEKPYQPRVVAVACRIITAVKRDQPGGINPGDIYEDCAFHPVLCTSRDDDELQGISLIDATAPRACSLTHCGVIKLSIQDVTEARADWPAYFERRRAELASDQASDLTSS